MRDLSRRLYLAFTFAVLVTITSACGGPPAEHHTLWKVSTPRADIYLLGSVHVLRESDYPLPEVFDRAWRETDVLVLELTPEAFAAAEVSQALRRRAALPSGVSLADVLGRETWDRARELADDAGVDLIGMARVEPWFAAVMILNMSLAEAGFQSGLGVDQHFADRARDADRPVWALETPEDQISIFDTMPQELQERFLIMTLEEADSAGEQTEELMRAWREGDSESLEEILGEGFDEFPELYDALVTHRNEAWFEKLQTWTGDGEDLLVVVGSLHLVGPDGLVEMFREAGYEVEQL